MRRSIAMRALPWTGLALLTITLAWAGRPATGQEESGAKPAAAKKAKKFRGRLPNHYRHVVDEKQRQEIYKIQEEYASRLAALKAQLAAMTKERDEKVVAVLTPEQLKKVEQLAAEAKAKRDEKKKKPVAAKPAQK